jgi:hypothetical protein
MERSMDDQDKQTQAEQTQAEPNSSGEEVAYESDWYEVLKRRAEEEADEELASVDGDDG